MSSLPSRNETLTIAVKKHAEIDIIFLKPCPIVLYLFTSCQIFCPGLYLSSIYKLSGKTFPNHNHVIMDTDSLNSLILSNLFLTQNVEIRSSTPQPFTFGVKTQIFSFVYNTVSCSTNTNFHWPKVLLLRASTPIQVLNF